MRRNSRDESMHGVDVMFRMAVRNREFPDYAVFSSEKAVLGLGRLFRWSVAKESRMLAEGNQLNLTFFFSYQS